MSTPPRTTRAEQIEHLAELISDNRICMLTTLDPDGKPWSRPMGVQDAEFDGDLWFFTRDDSEKAEHIHRNANVGVAFSRPSDQEYVTMAGTAEIVRDQQRVHALWNDLYTTWFPDGPDDPHLALIKVTIERAEYWDAPNSFVTYALGYVKAKLTGEPADDLAENEKVSL